MQTVSGQVVRFLENPRGVRYGVVLEDGEVVRFPAEKTRQVFLILSVGSHVGVQGVFHSGDPSGDYWEPSLITNFDSHRSVNFLAATRQVGPGMLPDNAPDAETSLVPSRFPAESLATNTPPVPQDLPPAQPSRGSEFLAARRPYLTTLSLAYDSLHRVQAILAYLRIVKRHVPGISQLLDEAKHTYVQALSHCDSRNLAAAAEFAAASASLSHVVEMLISRTIRTDAGLPSLVPCPPHVNPAAADSADIDAILSEVECVLSRIRWLLARGTLPLDERTQVRRVAAWGEALYQQAQQSYRQAGSPDAVEFAQAALEGAHGAEHLCRQWYLGHSLPSPNDFSESFRRG